MAETVVELGYLPNSTSFIPDPPRSRWKSRWSSFWRFITPKRPNGGWQSQSWSSLWQSIVSTAMIGRNAKKTDDNKLQPQVEDFRKGYPRFAALMGAHNSFHIFRRFSDLRIRLLLLAQDGIVELEEKLRTIDQAEKSPLFLASRRLDRNSEREEVISQLFQKFQEYDRLLESTRQAFAFETPKMKYVRALQRWLKGNPCIARNEFKFLDSREEDLLTLYSMEDGAVAWLEHTLSDGLVYLTKGSSGNISRDPHVRIFPRSRTVQAARLILTPLLVILLLAPVVMCNFVTSLTARLVIVVITTAVFICSLAALTKTRTIELAMVGAAYATLLVVFIVGNLN